MIDRGTITVDASALEETAAWGELIPLPNPTTGYIDLRAADAQCRAAAHSSVANLIDIERRLAADSLATPCPGKDHVVRPGMTLLSLRAAGERNKSASSALQAFYHLAELESARDSLQHSHLEIRGSISDIEQLKSRGLRVEADDPQLRQQEIELLKQQAELHATTAQLNAQLRVLVGLDSPICAPIWPCADLKVALDGPDCETAIATGLATRTDLIILRVLLANLDADTLAVAKATLAQADASLGTQGAKIPSLQRLLHPIKTESEISIRRVQLRRLLADQETVVVEEIRTCVSTIDARLRQIALASEALDRRRERLRELNEKRPVGDATALAVATARLEVIGAEKDLVHQVVEWRIAQVKLKAAQGLLAVECGFDPCHRCECK